MNSPNDIRTCDAAVHAYTGPGRGLAETLPDYLVRAYDAYKTANGGRKVYVEVDTDTYVPVPEAIAAEILGELDRAIPEEYLGVDVDRLADHIGNYL